MMYYKGIGKIMDNSSEERLKIAVFVDFDNISIGVKQSLNRNFDIGTVLEAIKEKGEVVTKVAYGDWKRAEDYSRAMTQHAVQMVQRNLTPGGDKNGADIALALDALEMAFTRNHINAFVIVGGDSDFIALVEKLKQYDKTVFVVGGRAFTSVILQKNCHEFISYENLVGIQSGIKKYPGKTQAIATPSALETALPLIRRALKILSDREVSPQLGLLKSTLLQLDSTFSERDFGVSSFRDFIQKLADTGHVNLKQVDRSLLVELREIPETPGRETVEPPVVAHEAPPVEVAAPAEPPANAVQPGVQSAVQSIEAIRVLEDLLRESKSRPHWPMYLRSFKQYLRSLQPPFDERQFGFPSTYDLVRQAQKEGLLRVERNRQGVLRIFPTERFPQSVQPPSSVPDSIATEEAEPGIEIMSAEPEVATPEINLQQEIPEPIMEMLPEAEPAAEAEPLETAPEERPKAAIRKRKPPKTTKTGKGERRKTKPKASAQGKPPENTAD
jgi:uncharacterized LabA/DUF88 family protein